MVHQQRPCPPTNHRCHPHTANAPLPPPPRVPTQPRGGNRTPTPASPHPPASRSPRTPTAQDYEESPRPADASSRRDLMRPTHAHSSAQGHGPAQGQWWRRWTNTQLWELRRWAREEPSLEGLVHRPRKGLAENRCLQPAGGVDATGCMGSHAGQCAPPPGSPPPQPPRARGPPICPQAPAGDPPGDATRLHTPVGHQPQPNPAHTHPLATPQVSAHRHQRHPQHPWSPVRHTARRA